jgi:hypothetical protein
LRISRAGWLTVAAAGALAAALLSIRPANAAIHHAALVVQHSSGRVITRCVAFAQEQISGIQLIKAAGVEYRAQSFGSIGSAICQLDSEPSPMPAGCFGSGPYWQYAHGRDGGWQAASTGADAAVLHDGDLDGWRYASGSNQTPPPVSYGSVCRAPTPAAATSQAASTAPSRRTPVTPTSAPAAASPRASPSLVALLPTASPSPTSALAVTGVHTTPRTSNPIGRWWPVAVAALLLLGLGAINWRRRSS